MTLKINTALQDALVTQVSTSLGNTTAVLDIYTGAQPANANTAPTGTLLASIPIAGDWAVAASGSQVLNGTETATAGAAGTAGWGRLHDAGNTIKIDGTVATSAATYIVDTVTCTIGSTINLTACTLTQPAS